MAGRFIAPLILTVLVAASCAHPPPRIRSAGRDFPSAGFATLRLKQSTDPQVEAVLGPPFKRVSIQTTVTKPNGPLPIGTPISFSIVNYLYLLTNGGPAASGHAVAKTATLVFYDGTLAAYDLNSTIPGEENQPVDSSRLTLLKQGVTTRADIIALLGVPSGQSIAFPHLPNALGHITYVWTHIEGQSLLHKILIIDLDRNDVLTHYALYDGLGPAPVLPPMPGLQGPAPFAPSVPPGTPAPQQVGPKPPLVRT
jgi:hypothetical protein